MISGHVGLAGNLASVVEGGCEANGAFQGAKVGDRAVRPHERGPGWGSRPGFARDLGGDGWRLGRGDERLRRPGGGSLPQIRDFGPVLRKVQLRERVQGCRSQ